VKLSEAILLGSTILAPKPGVQFVAEKQEGCALGMAAIANGCTYGPPQDPEKGESRRTIGTAGVWGEWVKKQVARPCSCWFFVPRKMQIQEIIAHIFDRHIAGEKKDWTIDELAKWVESVEPQMPKIEAIDGGVRITVPEGCRLTQIEIGIPGILGHEQTDGGQGPIPSGLSSEEKV